MAFNVKEPMSPEDRASLEESIKNLKDPNGFVKIIQQAVDSLSRGLEECLVRGVALEGMLVKKGYLSAGDLNEMDRFVAGTKAKLEQKYMAEQDEILKILEVQSPDLAELYRKFRASGDI